MLVGLPAIARPAVLLTMSTKSRQTIYGGRIISARIRADGARETARQAIREADRAEAEAWSIQMGLWWPRATFADHRAMP